MVNSKPQLFFSKVIDSQISKILLIIHSDQLANLLKLELSHEGYVVEMTHSGISGLQRWRETQPQLIIVDWSISDLAAPDLCYRVRSSNSQIPILVFTSGQKISDRIAALDAGGDDCISQPFSITELLARIRAHLRRNCLKAHLSLLTFDNLKLDTLTREVHRDDVYIFLTVKEFALLKYLMTHPRQVLTKSQILERVWGYDFMGDSNVIEVYVRYLRLKLEQNNCKRLIHTVRGVGYVLRELSL
jgi:DNA-binding response OmpR family regulator